MRYDKVDYAREWADHYRRLVGLNMPDPDNPEAVAGPEPSYTSEILGKLSRPVEYLEEVRREVCRLYRRVGIGVRITEPRALTPYQIQLTELTPPQRQSVEYQIFRHFVSRDMAICVVRERDVARVETDERGWKALDWYTDYQDLELDFTCYEVEHEQNRLIYREVLWENH